MASHRESLQASPTARGRGLKCEMVYGASRRQVDSLTPSLLAKAFRGELVPQDPTHEPASALLERIRVARVVSRTGKRERGPWGLSV